VAGVSSFSNAMHGLHTEEFPNPNSMDACFSCHPGPTTQCLRDAMSLNVTAPLDPTRKMNCIDCYGGMTHVAQNPDPWLKVPHYDGCHTPTDTQEFNLNQPLYHHSIGPRGVYCEAWHDSIHAIATSREPNDANKFIQLQGHSGTLSECTVCHITQPPTETGSHDK
jgi:hypothetical protein